MWLWHAAPFPGGGRATVERIKLELDQIPAPLVVVDAGDVVDFNAQAAAFLGLDAADACAVRQALGWSSASFGSLREAITGGGTATVEQPSSVPGRSGPFLLVASVTDDAGLRLVLRLEPSSADGRARTQLERRLQFERILTEAAASLIRSDEAQLDEAIDALLGSMGRFFGVDRAYVFLIDAERERQANTHEWVAAGVSSERDNLQDLPLSTFPWLLSELRADRIVRLESIESLPDDASHERAEFEREGIQSILIVPLWVGGALHGFVGFDAVRRRVCWDEPFVIGLRLMAQVLASALDARELSRRLKGLALHDALTGLPNRTLLQDRFEQTSRRVHHDGEHVLVAVVDVDDFKLVNDRFGHPAGDALLCELGARLRAVLRDTDTVARIGGDEFVILAHGAGPSELAGLAQRLLSTVENPFDLGAIAPLKVGLSIGVAQEQAPGGSGLDGLLRDADAAMYVAKTGGKNRWAQAAAPDCRVVASLAGS